MGRGTQFPDRKGLVVLPDTVRRFGGCDFGVPYDDHTRRWFRLRGIILDADPACPLARHNSTTKMSGILEGLLKGNGAFISQSAQPVYLRCAVRFNEPKWYKL